MLAAGLVFHAAAVVAVALVLAPPRRFVPVDIRKTAKNRTSIPLPGHVVGCVFHAPVVISPSIQHIFGGLV
ncbi:hypothetical protein B0H14DRAFT_2722058 [Mycena olivaceomarginata]|nr:hypothetical protein B0H14DRAFT_2722058 [Mycena olivaceomarginata]